MNSVQLIGRLVRDPEIRQTNSGLTIAAFNIGIDRPPKQDGTKEADFPRVTVFGKQAENCGKFLTKGKLVGISGRIQTGSYTNNEGQKIYTTDVVANYVEFLEWGERNAKQGFQQNQQQGFQQNQQGFQQNQQPQQTQQGFQPPQQPPQQQAFGFEQISDEDIPF